MAAFDRRRSWLVAVALVVLATTMAACGDDDDGGDGDADGTGGDAAAFCSAWDDALTSEDNAGLAAALADPPAELADAAEAVLDTLRSGTQTGDGSAQRELLAWVEVNCRPEVATEDAQGGDRRVGLVLEATPEDLTFCGSVTTPDFDAPRGRAVLYGDTGGGDPYGGEMLGLFFGAQSSHAGDGETTPVQVRGVEGTSGPISVFQQVVLPDLGTVIAWEEDGQQLGLYGRLWDASRVPELVAIADAIDTADGAFSIPSSSLPDGYEAVYDGDTSAFDLIVTIAASYELRYQVVGDPSSQLALRGQEMTQEAYDAVGFFALPGLERVADGGRELLSGSPWGELGPALVTYRDDDGLVVRGLGIGSGGTLERVRSMVDQAEELDRDAWLELAAAAGSCDSPPAPAGP